MDTYLSDLLEEYKNKYGELALDNFIEATQSCDEEEVIYLIRREL